MPKWRSNESVLVSFFTTLQYSEKIDNIKSIGAKWSEEIFVNYLLREPPVCSTRGFNVKDKASSVTGELPI